MDLQHFGPLVVKYIDFDEAKNCQTGRVNELTSIR